MKEMFKSTADGIKNFISTGRGKIIITASVAVIAVTISVVAMTGGANTTVIATAKQLTSSDKSMPFTAASAITVPDTSSGAVVATSSFATSDAPSKPADISVQTITLNKTSIRLNVGQSMQLTYTILPASVTDKSVSWDSSDKSVATINTSCTVTAKAPGATIVKVTASNGLNATCTVNVNPVSTAIYTQQPSTTTTTTPVPTPKPAATNAAGIASYSSYGFPHGVSVSNTQVLKENWNFNQMVSDVTKGVELGDTVNYSAIPSNYKTQMEYYWGGSSGGQTLVTDWINEIKQYHINETCDFNTSTNDIYQDSKGEMLIRGMQTIHIISADAGYYNEGGISGPGTYYRIIDIVDATGGQNGYGIPQSMYSINGELKYTGWIRV